MTLRLCLYCQSTFLPQRKDKLYCSNSCKQMAFAKRQEDVWGIDKNNLQKLTYGGQIPYKTSIHQNVKQASRQVNEQSIHTNTFFKKQLLTETSSRNVNISEKEILKLKTDLYSYVDAIIELKLEELLKTKNVNDVTQSNASEIEKLQEDKTPEIKDDDSEADLFLEETSSDTLPIIKPKTSIEESVNTQTVNSANNVKQSETSSGIQNVNSVYHPSVNTVASFRIQNVNNQNFINESETIIDDYKPVKCKWIDVIFEKFEKRKHNELLCELDNPSNLLVSPTEWVSTHYRCLLESVLTIANIKAIVWDDIAELSNAFTFMLNSGYYKDLPNAYPYKKDIATLARKIKAFCLETQNEEYVKFSLQFETKKNLLLQRFELSSTYPKISFRELQTNFTNGSM